MKFLIDKLKMQINPELRELISTKDGNGYEGWQLLDSPVLTILEWNKLYEMQKPTPPSVQDNS